MCIAIIKRSSNPDYAFFIGLNRDEKYAKHWDEISNHWSQYPYIYGYRDHDTGGTWFAYNKRLTAFLINREEDNFEYLRSRAYIVLIALRNAFSLEEALDNLSKVDASLYKPFNLIVLNNESVVLATNYSDGRVYSQVKIVSIEDDLVFINRSFPNDLCQKRIALNMEIFSRLKEPNPRDNCWDEWKLVLTTECNVQVPDDESSLWINSKEWGTLLSDIIAIPRQNNQKPFIHRVKSR